MPSIDLLGILNRNGVHLVYMARGTAMEQESNDLYINPFKIQVVNFNVDGLSCAIFTLKVTALSSNGKENKDTICTTRPVHVFPLRPVLARESIYH